MAKTLDQLPSLPQALSGTDIILIKTVIEGTPLDFKIDINTFLQDYLKVSEVGTEVNDLIRLVDDGGGNPGLPPISGALLTNIQADEATEIQKGVVFLSDATDSGNDVSTGFAATSKAVRDVSVASVQKTGDTMSGDLTFVNNFGIDFTKFGGGTFNGVKIDVNDDLVVGEVGNTFANIKLLSDTSVKVCDNAGVEVFSFNTDGTITGVNADDIAFTPYTFVTATEVQSAIQQVADAAITGGGGEIDGPIIFGNGVGISTRNAADTFNLPTIFMDNNDDIVIGAQGANIPNDVVIKKAGKVSITDGAGVEVFALNANGSISGFDSVYIDFADGGFTATNVNAALVELNNEKLSTSGGAVTGDFTFSNNTGISAFNFGGTPVEVFKVDASDNLVFNQGATKFQDFDVTLGDDFIIRNSGGSVLFQFNQDGSSSGILAGDVTSTPTGGITATDVQTAISQLESNKLNSSGGVISNNLTFLNNTPLRMEKADTSDIDVMKVDTSNNLVFGTSTNRFNDYNIRMDGDFIIRDTAGATLFSVTQAGAVSGITAAGISFTPTGNVSATDVQAAIAELDSEKLGLSAKAADSNLLDGVNSTAFARNDAAYTQSAAVTFNDSVDLRFGSSGASDSEVFYDGSGNQLIVRLATNATAMKIRDNATDRFTFSKSTGDFTATGNITAFSDIRVKTKLEVIENAFEKVCRLTGWTYDRIDIDVPRQTGLDAQSVQKELPEAVIEDVNGNLSVAYGNMMGLVVEALKDIRKELDEIKKGGV